MKPNILFALCFVGALAAFMVQDNLAEGGAGASRYVSFHLCLLLGVTVQLNALASAGAKGLRRVSLLWMLLAIGLASAVSAELEGLVAIFFAGVAFSYLPSQEPAG